MSKPVHLLSVTTLSRLRKDGHPSVYNSGGHMAMDCSHWCMASVLDTWNQCNDADVTLTQTQLRQSPCWYKKGVAT
ncbi:Protein trichome birefringence-like 42 [Linum perenne]